jgi:hypothetical protein
MIQTSDTSGVKQIQWDYRYDGTDVALNQQEKGE